jgi:hypothetical protein
MIKFRTLLSFANILLADSHALRRDPPKPIGKTKSRATALLENPHLNPDPCVLLRVVDRSTVLAVAAAFRCWLGSSSQDLDRFPEIAENRLAFPGSPSIRNPSSNRCHQLTGDGRQKNTASPPPCSRLAILDRPLYFRRRCGFTAAAAFDQPSR